MFIHQIKLKNFRNYETAVIDFNNGVNMICGQNAQGKTNLLEAVFFLSNIKTFRSSNKKDVIQFLKDDCEIIILFHAYNREFELKVQVFTNKALQIFVNGVRQKKQDDVKGILKSVLFCPDDLYLIRDGAAARRQFIDTAMCQLRPRYATYLDEYNKLLEHKTRILRDSEEKPSLLLTLDDFTARMAHIGGYIIRYRAYFIRSLAQKAQDIHLFMSGGKEKLELTYKTVSSIDDVYASGIDIGKGLLVHAEQHKNAEIASRSCLSGPHKDDIEIYINEFPAKNYASQGQIRTSALSLKLAERDMFFDDTGEYPVLLLDDVLSELDKTRQDFVINRINGGQVFITCCEEEKLANVIEGKNFIVENGRIL